MSVYNGQRFLREAIDSVLAQTFDDWELIVIDDASTDSTPNVLAEYHDPRIRVLHNEKNRRQAVCSNHGIAAASGRYIARLDADDVSLPGRLSEQFSYLESHPEVTLLASAAHLIDEGGSRFGLQPGGFNDCTLKFTLAMRNPLIHSAVIFRTEAARELNGYDEDPQYWVTEDWEFLSRIAFHGKACVTEEPLVEYRVHPSSVSLSYRESQEDESHRIARTMLKRTLGLEVDNLGWEAWQRFTRTKSGVAVSFEGHEVKRLSVLISGLLKGFTHDRKGSCVLPWYWAKHAFALAIGRRGHISIGARARFLVLALKIAIQKVIWH